MYRLAAEADVFVTNFPLPVRDRLKLSPEHLLPLNPRLIYASFTAYGEAGEEAARTGFDSTAYWARTGLMDAVRADVDTAPARSAPGMGDHPSATGLYAAIVTALYRRERPASVVLCVRRCWRTGSGRMAASCRHACSESRCRTVPPREQAPNALANHYCCRDGRWFIMALFNEERQLRPLLNAIGREELADDPRFATKQARKKNAWALVEELDAVFATRDMEHWHTVLGTVGVTFGAVGKTDDVMHDEQMRANGALVPFADGKTLTVSSPFQVEGETKVPPRYAPTIGQHSEEVLQEAGYSADDIGRLRTLGVLA